MEQRIEVDMKSPFVAVIALLAAVEIPAHTRETAIVAAMRLCEVPNYSWTCTVTDDARAYDIEGKTELRGLTWQRQPMPQVIARRLGREAGYELEAIFSAPLSYVILTENGWRTIDELPKQHSDWSDGYWYFPTSPGSMLRTPDMPADAHDVVFGLPPAIYVPVMNEEEEGKVYSNAQFALALPHEELGVIVSSHADFQVEENVVSGTLTDIGAQLLLVHDGHEYIKPVTAGGRFRLWLNDEWVEKYSVELAGVVVVDRKAIYVRQQSMTFVKDVGTTRLAVPAEARRRL
jgi:hypothetical protein